MNLRVGMIGFSLGWEELLRQEGVPYGAVPIGEGGPSEFSVIIAARVLTPHEIAYLKEFLRSGGAVLGYAGFITGLVESTPDPVRLRYLCQDESSLMGGISLMDIETEGVLPREANCLRTQENVFCVFFGEVHGGWGVVLPFDPANAIEDFRAAERYFYARPERLPSERVSRVGKGEVQHLIHAALENLHHVRGLPYARLAQFPAGWRGVFALRVDTDGCDEVEVKELSSIAEDSGLRFSWFVDVRSHESWLSRFTELRGHEVGLHCYEHRIFLDGPRDAENVRHGRELLEKSGVSVLSYAAPFGFWSPDLGRIIDEQGFSYSSEFSWAFDTVPQRPVIGAMRFKTLQVPVHPVSIGNLRRAGFTSAQMSAYYSDTAERKIQRGEPLFFYHHPGHREWDVVRELCRLSKGNGILPLTLGEYAQWWQRRELIKPVIQIDGATIAGSDAGGTSPVDIRFDVTLARGKSALLPCGAHEQLDRLSWSTAPAFRPPSDIKRIREFDLRGEIGRQFTRLQRRFL
ncbi:MAG: hypothetical protein AB1428_15340 [Bacteroidota bacterium]